jgi:hypothetical protein
MSNRLHDMRIGAMMVTRTNMREHTSNLFMISYYQAIRKEDLEPYSPAMMHTNSRAQAPGERDKVDYIQVSTRTTCR